VPEVNVFIQNLPRLPKKIDICYLKDLKSLKSKKNFKKLKKFSKKLKKIFQKILAFELQN